MAGYGAEIGLQEAVIDHRVGFGNIKVGQFFPMRQHLGKFLIELIGIKSDAVGFGEQDYPRKMLGGLDIHIFIIADMRQLRPEGDIQSSGPDSERHRHRRAAEWPWQWLTDFQG